MLTDTRPGATVRGSRQRQRVGLLVSCRPEEFAPDSLLPPVVVAAPAGAARLRLMLEPLDVPGTGEMVSSMRGGERVSDEFATFLHDRTDVGFRSRSRSPSG